MFQRGYLLQELRRRWGRTLVTALGLAVGVGLVLGIIGLSQGLSEAQTAVLQPLSSIGTDILVTRVATSTATSNGAQSNGPQNNGGGFFGPDAGGGGAGGGVTVVSLYPGLVRTEKVMEAAPWLDMTNSESPEFIGRAVAALATDPDVLRHTGKILVAAALAKEYGFTDLDGTTPRPLTLADV